MGDKTYCLDMDIDTEMSPKCLQDNFAKCGCGGGCFQDRPKKKKPPFRCCKWPPPPPPCCLPKPRKEKKPVKQSGCGGKRKTGEDGHKERENDIEGYGCQDRWPKRPKPLPYCEPPPKKRKIKDWCSHPGFSHPR